MTVQTRKPFNGKHMTAILVAGFGVVLAVNVTMATLASTTFGGIVVENSYVASQDFNRWLDEAAKERALGWRLAARRGAEGRVVVDLTPRRPGLDPGPLAMTSPPSGEAPTAGKAPADGARLKTATGPGSSPGRREVLTAVARHPLGRLPDTALTFRREGGHWISTRPLPAGRWTLRFDIEADGRQWRTEQEIGA
ncbi:hypothetical protein LH128_04711 [Sphingomonas sp. LH128]|uniref:FixH family protein n=1 Tax=Sphingomonas sp. LH128 TaxID=473781 RepID=UPI00027CC739|nr:FixH family protein [Sphingomonas sp. LH128]EJU14219.1 hypothetical protein LH128_04711 [Sphingomonas sp. LH128]